MNQEGQGIRKGRGEIHERFHQVRGNYSDVSFNFINVTWFQIGVCTSSAYMHNIYFLSCIFSFLYIFTCILLPSLIAFFNITPYKNEQKMSMLFSS